MTNVFVWRTDAWAGISKDAQVSDANTGRQYLCFQNGHPVPCDWTALEFEELKKMITARIPEGENRMTAMDRIQARLDPSKTIEGEEGMVAVWANLKRSSPPPEVYEKNRSARWQKTGCAADGAPYVLRALLRRLAAPHFFPEAPKLLAAFLDKNAFAKDSPEVPELAAAFLDKDCAGARGLSKDEIAKLKKIAAPAVP